MDGIRARAQSVQTALIRVRNKTDLKQRWNQRRDIRPAVKTVWIASHHKAGTVWLRRHLRKALAPAGFELARLTFDHEVFNQIGPETGVAWTEALDIHSKLILDCHSVVPIPQGQTLRGIHITRNPRDLVLSGVVYHRVTKEPWASRQEAKYDGKSYQEVLKSMSDRDAVLEEIRHLGPTIRAMANWNYSDPRFLNLRFEDVMSADHKDIWRKILVFLDTSIDIDKTLKRLASLSPENERIRDSRRPVEQRHFSSNLSSKPIWTDEAENLLTSLYPVELNVLYTNGAVD